MGDNKTLHAGLSIFLAIIGVAILAIIVSKSADTVNVLGSFQQAISRMLCVALSPVTGNNCGASSVAVNIPSAPPLPPRGTANSTITYPGIDG